MSLQKESSAVSLRNRYIPALLLVAVFSIFAYINVEQIISSIRNDATVINTGGRQRMLSQNLILLGLKYLNNPSEKNRLTLEKNIELMRTSHKFLINNIKSTKLNSIYNENKLSAKLYAFLAKFNDYIKNYSEKSITQLSSDAQILLPLLSEAVEEYENINYLKVKRLEQQQLFILILTLILLMAEMLFIFYPASMQIKKNTDELEEFNNNLEKRIHEEVEKNREKDKQLIQQSRLAQMGEMISMIAHQWRQPLGAIGSVNSTIEIKATLDSLDKEKTLRYTNKISELIQHLSQTIDDFREFFKPDKEKVEVSCNELLRSVLNISTNSLQANNINLIQELNCDCKFKTYPSELKQVILNLIKNAEDILLEHNIENPYIKLSTYCDINKIIIEINDNGGGIDKGIIDKIFDPYFSTKKHKNGTGLGLYMSKTIIEDHCGGNLRVSNNSNGAVFQIILLKDNNTCSTV